MRKIKVCLYFTFLLLPAISFCQTNYLEAGISGGSGIRILSGEYIDNKYTDPAIGYHFGGTIQYHFGKIFSLRTDPSFEQKGNTDYLILTDNVGNEIGHLDAKNNLNYIVLPVLGQLSLGNRIVFTIHAGAFAGYLIRNNHIMPAFETYAEQKINNTASHKRFDIGLAGGFGCQFPLKENFSIFMDARVNAGIFDIQKSPLTGPVYTNSLNVTLGIKYKFTKRTDLKESAIN
ncbi:MAG TPA: porin family protein [Bacteroidales bacterium]|nr:porin family protein [Bacteroidales bacterium]